ncbi:MAG: hypothetical protein [Inoviridae sp.]|nr:MAG: hypothetical protein [Inoviridae sp.]
MLIKLVGYVHKEGKFEDEKGREVAFDNVTLDLLTDTPMDNECVRLQGGLHVSSLKIKTPQIWTLFNPAIRSLMDLNSWLDKEITLEYSLLNSKPTLCGITLKGSK